jgi:hypothetical protein
MFDTVTTTGADVAAFPAASLDVAVSVWLPLLATVEFHEIE